MSTYASFSDNHGHAFKAEAAPEAVSADINSILDHRATSQLMAYLNLLTAGKTAAQKQHELLEKYIVNDGGLNYTVASRVICHTVNVLEYVFHHGQKITHKYAFENLAQFCAFQRYCEQNNIADKAFFQAKLHEVVTQQIGAKSPQSLQAAKTAIDHVINHTVVLSDMSFEFEIKGFEVQDDGNVMGSKDGVIKCRVGDSADIIYGTQAAELKEEYHHDPAAVAAADPEEDAMARALQESFETHRLDYKDAEEAAQNIALVEAAQIQEMYILELRRNVELAIQKLQALHNDVERAEEGFANATKEVAEVTGTKKLLTAEAAKVKTDEARESVFKVGQELTQKELNLAVQEGTLQAAKEAETIARAALRDLQKDLLHASAPTTEEVSHYPDVPPPPYESACGGDDAKVAKVQEEFYE